MIGSALVVAGLSMIASVVWPQFLVLLAYWIVYALAVQVMQMRRPA